VPITSFFGLKNAFLFIFLEYLVDFLIFLLNEFTILVREIIKMERKERNGKNDV